LAGADALRATAVFWSVARSSDGFSHVTAQSQAVTSCDDGCGTIAGRKPFRRDHDHRSTITDSKRSPAGHKHLAGIAERKPLSRARTRQGVRARV
jgi:hypothetical protein